MTAEVMTCTRRELDAFWDDTFGPYAPNVYLDDGGPTEDQWADPDPDAVMTFTDGWFSWQPTDGCRWADDIVDPDLRKRIQKILNGGDLPAVFARWRQQHDAQRITVVVSIPSDTIGALDAPILKAQRAATFLLHSGLRGQLHGDPIPLAAGTMDHGNRPGSTADMDLVDRGHQGWVRMAKVGKARAGNLLDGALHQAFPDPRVL